MIEINYLNELIQKLFSDKDLKSVSFTVKNVEKTIKKLGEVEGYNIAWDISGDTITVFVAEE